MKVVSFKICPFVQRVTASLIAKGLPYEIEYISLKDSPKWFLEVSPNLQVPLLMTDSGVTLFESDAIIEYLDELYPPLQKDLSAEQRAINRAWSYQASKHYLVQCSVMQSADEQTFFQRVAKLNQAFKKVAAVLDSRPYFQGETIGNVDIAWLVLLHRAAIVENQSGYDFIANFPEIKKWQTKLLEENTAKLSVASDFFDRFSDFYFRNDTYLGKLQGGVNVSAFSGKNSGCCG